MSAAKDIHSWQQRYRTEPGIWTVIVHGETTGNIYDSREAAELEVAWHQKRGTRGARASFLGHVHTLELSRDRWKT